MHQTHASRRITRPQQVNHLKAARSQTGQCITSVRPLVDLELCSTIETLRMQIHFQRQRNPYAALPPAGYPPSVSMWPTNRSHNRWHNCQNRENASNRFDPTFHLSACNASETRSDKTASKSVPFRQSRNSRRWHQGSDVAGRAGIGQTTKWQEPPHKRQFWQKLRKLDENFSRTTPGQKSPLKGDRTRTKDVFND